MPVPETTKVPTDGDERPMGDTNRLSGLSGLGLGFAAVIIVLIIAAIVLTVVTGQHGPNF